MRNVDLNRAADIVAASSADHDAQWLAGSLRREGDDHNGYENYETFVVAMYLAGNYTDRRTPEMVRAVVAHAVAHYDRENVADGTWTEDQAKLYAAEDALREWTTDQARNALAGESSLAADLLGSALQEVDWRRLAELEIDGLDADE